MNTDTVTAKRILASNLTFHRKRLGYTQKEVAKRAEIGLSTYGSYEDTRNFPAISKLTKVANVLGVTISDLLKKP